jgi:hypothetical protein
VLILTGCAPPPNWTAPPGPPIAVVSENPAFLPVADPQRAWETVVDVIDDYFKIEREEPVRLIGNVLTEGRIDTFPQVGATILEPWHQDSANLEERVESTLQSIRRKAIVRVMPTQGGYWVDVTVLKELEDIPPERATAGAATLRYDNSLTRVVNPVGAQQLSSGWIPQGRDAALEQRIIGHLQSRCGR